MRGEPTALLCKLCHVETHVVNWLQSFITCSLGTKRNAAKQSFNESKGRPTGPCACTGLVHPSPTERYPNVTVYRHTLIHNICSHQ